jgi:hypothetical protein
MYYDFFLPIFSLPECHIHLSIILKLENVPQAVTVTAYVLSPDWEREKKLVSTVAEKLRRGFKLTTIRPYRQHEQILHISVLTGEAMNVLHKLAQLVQRNAAFTLPPHSPPQLGCLNTTVEICKPPLPSSSPQGTAPEQTCRNLQSQKFGEQGGGGLERRRLLV